MSTLVHLYPFVPEWDPSKNFSHKTWLKIQTIALSEISGFLNDGNYNDHKSEQGSVDSNTLLAQESESNRLSAESSQSESGKQDLSSRDTFIAHICLDLALFIYVIYFLPQLYHNTRSKDNLGKISLITQLIMILAHLCNLSYAFGCNLPLQYKLPSMIAIFALGIQEWQLFGFYKKRWVVANSEEQSQQYQVQQYNYQGGQKSEYSQNNNNNDNRTVTVASAPETEMSSVMLHSDVSNDLLKAQYQTSDNIPQNRQDSNDKDIHLQFRNRNINEDSKNNIIGIQTESPLTPSDQDIQNQNVNNDQDSITLVTASTSITDLSAEAAVKLEIAMLEYRRIRFHCFVVIIVMVLFGTVIVATIMKHNKSSVDSTESDNDQDTSTNAHESDSSHTVADEPDSDQRHPNLRNYHLDFNFENKFNNKFNQIIIKLKPQYITASRNCMPFAQPLGELAAFLFFCMVLPQVIRNFQQQDGGGFSTAFLILDSMCYVLHIIAAQILALPFISTLSPCVSLTMTVILLLQKVRFGE